jgi:hypothetical protein
MRWQVRFLFSLLLGIMLNQTLHGQEPDIIEYSDKPLSEVLSCLEKERGYRFAYDNALTDSKRVSVTVNFSDGDEALTAILKSAGFKFNLIDGVFVIVPDEMIKPALLYRAQGYVVDSLTGERLPYSVICLKDPGNTFLTNADGYFSFECIISGRSMAVVSAMGHLPATFYMVADTSVNTLEIKLSPAFTMLDEVSVEGESARNGLLSYSQGHFAVGMSGLMTMPQAGETDIFRAIQLLPGVGATDETSSKLFMRGISEEYNLVLLDGIPLYNLDHFFGVFSTLNGDFIKDTRVYKSGYPARYGGRVSGIVEMTGKTGNRNKASASVSVNMLGAGISFESPLGKKISLITTYRGSFTGIYRSPAYRSILNSLRAGEYQTTFLVGSYFETVKNNVEPEIRYYDLNSRITYTPSANHSVVFSFYRGRDFFTLADSAIGITASLYTRKKIDWGNTGASLKWTGNLIKIVTTRLTACISDFSGYHDNSGIAMINSISGPSLFDTLAITCMNRLDDFFLKFESEFNPGGRHKPVAGIEYSNRNTVLVSGGIPENGNLSMRADEVNLFAQDEFSAGKRMILNAGIRFTGYDNMRYLYLDPRLTGRYKVTAGLILKGALTVHHQFLTRAFVTGNPATRFESWMLADSGKAISANHAVAGVEYESDGFSADFESYLITSREITNSTNMLSPGFFPAGSWNGRGKSAGIDLFLRKKHRSGESCLSYSYCRSLVKFDNINNGEFFPADRVQNHELKIMNTSMIFKKLECSILWIYGIGKPGSRPYANIHARVFDSDYYMIQYNDKINNYVFPAYHRLDASVNYIFSVRNLRVVAGMSLINAYGRRNIKDKQYSFFNPDTGGNNGAIITREEYIYSPGMFLNAFLKITI